MSTTKFRWTTFFVSLFMFSRINLSARLDQVWNVVFLHWLQPRYQLVCSSSYVPESRCRPRNNQITQGQWLYKKRGHGRTTLEGCLAWAVSKRCRPEVVLGWWYSTSGRVYLVGHWRTKQRVRFRAMCPNVWNRKMEWHFLRKTIPSYLPFNF